MEKTELKIQKRVFIEKELRGVLDDVDNQTEDGRQRVQEKILSFSIFAGFATRGKPIYDSDTDLNKKDFENKKIKFKAHLKNLMVNCDKKYIGETIVSDDGHIENIKSFISEAKTGYESILDSGKIRFGVGQKLLNLYLKYLWVLDDKTNFTPPHCPFDGQVIAYLHKNIGDKKLKNKIKNISWTKMDNIEDYQNLIKTAAEIVSEKEDYKSIAEWELKFWNEKMYK